MHEVTITRSEVLIVDKVAPHTYQGKTEGIDVYCKDGSKHKVSETHKSLWPVFQPGMAVEVGYGEFNNRPFIHTARQVKDGISPPVPVAPVNAPRNEPQGATLPKEHLAQAVKSLNGDDRVRSMALAYAKDLVMSGKVELCEIYIQADDFIKYILNVK